MEGCASWDRKGALFDASRLYRQAIDGARELLDGLEGHPEPLRSAVGLLTDKGTALEIDTKATLDAAAARLEQYLKDSASRLSAYHVLPVLVEATNRAYFGDDAEWARRWGPAIKIAAAFAYPAVFSPSAGGRTSTRAALTQFVLDCAALDQVFALRQALEVGASGRAQLTPTGLALDATLGRSVDECARAFGAGGRVQRMASAMPSILSKPKAVVAGIQKVLGGLEAHAVPELAGTILGNIDDPNPAFWSGLLARVIVAGMAANTRAAVTTEQTGVAILGPAGIVAPGVPGEALQAAIEALCWNREWHGQQRPEHYRHLLVRRPVVRISSTEHLLITDVSLILDSITSYLDLALAPDGGFGAIALHPSCFRKLLSEPFEQEVVEIFRSHGFRAGGVTEDGSWRIPAPIDLGRIAGPPPGEIDVLAVHPRGYGIVAECKVLALPSDANRMRNLMSKLGDADSEAFRAKLRRKVDWAWGLGEALGHLDGSPLGMIVLDRYLPGLRAEGLEFVVPIDALDHALRQLVATGGR